MNRRGKRVQTLKGVTYTPATDTFRFTLTDRTGGSHSFVCDFPVFEFLANELGTRLAQAESVRGDGDAIGEPVASERVRIDVGATDDGHVRLSVHSSRNKTFEVRFQPDITDGLIRNLEQARDHLAGRRGG